MGSILNQKKNAPKLVNVRSCKFVGLVSSNHLLVFSLIMDSSLTNVDLKVTCLTSVKNVSCEQVFVLVVCLVVDLLLSSRAAGRGIEQLDSSTWQFVATGMLCRRMFLTRGFAALASETML